jgi:hypothetical protein
MSTRERWIVYPLLFMTLGITLRDKVIPPAHLGNLGMQFEAGAITTHRIRCNELQVGEEAGAITIPRIRCNELQVGEVVCDRLESKQSVCRTLLVNGPNGRPVVIAGADTKTRAGIVETFTASGIPQVRLLSTDTGGMVVTFEAKRSTPQPPKEPAAPGKTPDKQPPSKTQDSGK